MAHLLPSLDYKRYEMCERLTGANTIAANLTHRFSGKMKLSHHDGLSDSQHHQPTCVVSAQSGIQDQPFSPGLLFLLSPCCHRGASSSNSLHTLISFWTGKPTSGTFWGISRKIHHKHQIWCSWNKGPKKLCERVFFNWASLNKFDFQLTEQRCWSLYL